MPFLDDTGIQTEVERGPLWSAFAAFASQLERAILLNLLWSVQLLPAITGIAFFQLPDVLRLALIVYTLAALPPATAILYGVVARLAEDEHINPDTVRDVLRDKGRAGFVVLVPLYGSLGFLAWAAQVSSEIMMLSALLQLLLLIELVAANYWGPLLIATDRPTAPGILLASLRLIWRRPVQTGLLTGVVGLALLLGTISVGGLFLAVPVIIALLQMYMFRTIHPERTDGTIRSH